MREASFDADVFDAVRACQPEAYGVSLKNHFRTRGRSHSLGRIYASLERLEGEGFVVSRSVSSPDDAAVRGGRPKLLWTPTRSGFLRRAGHGVGSAAVPEGIPDGRAPIRG